MTIWKLLKNVAKILEPKYNESFDKIGGNNIIVEIDESKFGKRKYHRGHKVEGVWIIGMVERTEQKRIKLMVVDDRTAETINTKLFKIC